MLFDTTDYPLVFQDKFLEITLNLGSGSLFGLGERRTNFELTNGYYSIFAADAARIDYGYPGQ